MFPFLCTFSNAPHDTSVLLFPGGLPPGVLCPGLWNCYTALCSETAPSPLSHLRFPESPGFFLDFFFFFSHQGTHLPGVFEKGFMRGGFSEADCLKCLYSALTLD